MKNFNKYIAVSLCAMSLASCQDLDTEYLGNYVTTDQKKESLEKNPELALASVTGIFSNYSTYMTVYSNHFDFGYPAIMLGLDSQGQDLAGKQSGYNWYSYWEGWTAPNQSGTPAGMMWYHMYKNIKVANDLIATIDTETENEELKFYLAQGLAARAHDYFNLAQTFQFTYKGNESKPCVPILTDLNATEAGSNGAPRETVENVYKQILSDLDTAVSLLESTSVTPESVIDSKPKRLISLAAAYGLRARVNLVMNNWAQAASDAKAAIDNFNGRPYSMSEVSTPTFVSLDDASWMWGLAIAETDRVVTSGIVNFPSMMGTFSDGYNTAGAWRWCNKLLYESIPSRDVRKGWFLDENYTSPNLSAAQQKFINDYVNPAGVTYDADQTNFIMPYTQVKYGTYQGVVGQTTNAADIPLMRIEEMYYIQAEATAMSGNTSGAKTMLEEFVKTYRNPGYSVSASSQEDLQNEIWHERRIEFWGEGLSFFDIMRLNKGIDRVGGAFPTAYTYQIPAGDPVLIYCIPQGEITANPMISANDNNTESSKPTPVGN